MKTSPHQTSKRKSQKIQPGMLILVASFMAMIQYQNCAAPVNQSSTSSDPNYVAVPISGGSKNSTVSSNATNQAQMLFEVSSVVLTTESNALRPGGVCSLPSNSEQIQWQLSENTENSRIVLQGTESCSQGSFYVNLSSEIANLECDKSYSLSASLSGQGTAQMSIIKHCGSVAAN